jgi:hypothetical protein
MRICVLHWNGLSAAEVASAVRRTPQTVSNVINSDEGMEILAELGRRSLDTVLDVQATAQAYAPSAIEELVRLMFESKDDRVRKTSCTDILAIAGHQPVKRIAIERPDPVVDRYREMTEEQIKEKLLAELGAVSARQEENRTVH